MADNLSPLRSHSQQNIQTGKTVRLETGETASVYSGSVEDPRLNEGRPTLIPFLWNGQILDEKQAIEQAVQSGETWPAFESHDEATAVSQALSESIETTEDFSDQYMQTKETQRRQSAAESMTELIRLRRLPERARPREEGAPPPVTPTEEPGNLMGPLKEIGKVGAAVTKTVGKGAVGGAVESPRQSLGGALDAIENTVHAVGDLFGWLDSRLPLGSVTFGGPEGLVQFEPPGIYGGAREIGETTLQKFEMPDVAGPETAIGGLARGITQFLLGFVGAGKTKPFEMFKPKTTGGGITKAAGQGMIADFSVFDPHEANLFNLLEKFPALKNPVIEYLAADPNDSAMEGRFKRTVEGLIFGGLGEGFFLAVKALRANAIAKEIIGKDKVEIPSEESVVGIKEDAFRTLGDETQEARILTPQKAPKVSEVQRQQIEATLPPGSTLDEAGEFYTIPGSDIPRNAALNPEARAVEHAFAQRLEGDYERAVAEYEALKGTKGGRVISADEAKALSPDYQADRSEWSNAVHEPASWFIKRYYAEKLAETVPKGLRKSVTFTAGGTGAGKSTAIDVLPEMKVVSDRSHLVYDGNLAGYNSGVRKIEQALASGHDVHVMYVMRDPIESWLEGVLKRAMGPKSTGQGRVVPVQTHASTHIRATETIKRLKKRYEGDDRVDIQIIDNTYGYGNSEVGSIDSLNKLNYNNLETRLRQSLDEAYANGTITEKIYRKTLEQSKA